MRTVEMFPEGSHRLACDPRVTRPTSPVIKKEEAPGLDLELLGGFVDGAPKKSRKKVVLADHVVPPCTLCARAKTNTKWEQPRRPLRDPHGDPAKGVMLVVLNAFADGVRYATEVIRAAGWEGTIYFDLPVRCGDGRKKIESKQVDACRTYLAYNMLVIKPTHILTCGTTSSRAVLGKTVMVHQTRGAWQLAEFRGRKVGVVATCSTLDASTNRFYARAFKDEVTKLVTTDWQALEFPRGVASVVETHHDLPAFKAWLRGAPFVAFDTETYGIQFRKDFRILSIAFSKPGSDEVFVFREALDNPLCLQAVKQALSSKMLWGANVQYDVRSVWCAWGLDISANLEVDVRLLYKSFWAGFASDLEEMANTVGFGQHKAEAAGALKAAKEELKEEWADDEDAPRDRIMAYAYAKLPAEIHERYVARDAYTTRCVGDHLVPLAKAHEFIWQHFEEVIMPACRKLLRIERRGMLFDRIKAKSVRMMVEERLSHYTLKLLNEGIDPDKADTIRAYFDREGIKINRLTKGAKQEAEERGYVLDTDKRSTDKRALLQAKLVVAAVKPQLEVISDCLEHRKVSKLHSANLKTIDRYIGDDGRCHPNFLLSTAGSGRACVREDTKILTNFGEVEIKEIPNLRMFAEVYVFSHTGRWNRVLDVFTKGVAPMVHVKAKAHSVPCRHHDAPWDGSASAAPGAEAGEGFVVCTLDHRLLGGGTWHRVRTLQAGSVVEGRGPAFPREGAARPSWGETRQGAPHAGGYHSLLQQHGHQSEPDCSRVRSADGDHWGQRHLLEPVDSRLVREAPAVEARTEGIPQAGQQLWAEGTLLRAGGCGDPPGSAQGGRGTGSHGEEVGHDSVPSHTVVQAPPDPSHPQDGHQPSAAAHGLSTLRAPRPLRTRSPGSGQTRELRAGPQEVLSSVVQSTPGAIADAGDHQGGGRYTGLPRLQQGLRPQVHHLLDEQVRGLVGGRASCLGRHGAPQTVDSPRGVAGGRGVQPAVRLRLGARSARRGSGWFFSRQDARLTASGTERRAQAGLGHDPRMAHSQGLLERCSEKPYGSRADNPVSGELHVVSIEPAGNFMVWDMEVENDHSYFAQGLFHHNTVKDPAAHSVPGRTEEGKAFKSCFIAPPGYVIGVFDYSTLEVFGAAFASNDQAMLDVLEPEDADFHLATAKKIAPLAWGITGEEVQRRFDLAKAEKRKCKERDQAKMVGLATMYGIGDEALAENIGTTKQEAGDLIRAFRTIYPDYRQWVLEAEEFVRRNGYTQAYWCGRKSRMRWLYDAGYPDAKRRSHALRAGSNHPIQSECSDYCLASGVVIEDRLEAEFDDPNTGIIMEVHDSIVMQIREDLLVPVARMVKEVMTSWPAGPFPLRVSAEVGPSWGEAAEWFFPPDEEAA